MFEFMDDVFTGVTEWFDNIDVGAAAGKVGKAALGAGVNIMGSGGSSGGLGSRQSRISHGITADRLGAGIQRPAPPQQMDPLKSVDPRTLQELWNSRMKEFARYNNVVGGKADAAN
jgi:hypothetical protein